jgi:anti-sigma factor RsiW
MDHEVAATRITDWVLERLTPSDARAVETHVGTCAACAEAATAARALRRTAGLGGRPSTPHLEPLLLARFTLTPDTLAVQELAACRAHLDECPACAHERDLVRAANAPSWSRALAAWLPSPAAPRALLAPALGVLALLLAVPAYLGIVELPRERGRHPGATTATTAPNANSAGAAGAPAWTGGGVDALILESATRGAGVVPTIHIRPGQPVQPILFQCDRPEGESVTLRLMGTGEVVAWTRVARTADIWDTRHHVVSLLVPVSNLVPGEYRLEVAATTPGAIPTTARFRVEASSPR